MNNTAGIYQWPLPQQTKSYSVIPNSRIDEICHEQATKNGLSIVEELVDSKRFGSTIVRYKMKPSSIADTDNDLSLMAAWKNSYDKTVSFGFAIGSIVNICTNGMVNGEFTLKRRHTGNAPLYVEEVIKEYFSKIKEVHLKNIKFKEVLQKQEIAESELNRFLGTLLRDKRRIFTAQQIQRFIKECSESVNFNTVGKDFTAWDLYNAGTESLKSSSVNSSFKRHRDFHNFAEEYFL